MIKTIKVEDIIDEVNFRNSHSTCSKEVREGWNGLLEYFLHTNGVYNGYMYLTEDRMRGDAESMPPGIRYVGKAYPEHPDITRKHYFAATRRWTKRSA